MYNRYTPQGDGSYRRSRMSEPEKSHQKPKEIFESPSISADIPLGSKCTYTQLPPRPHRTTPPVGISTFFKNLLPRDFDTEDLIIILLLLLMAGDCKEDQNYALLTLVLYLFL